MLGLLRRLLLPKRPPTLGQRGEAEAARYLRRQGLKILLRNYRCHGGEIDIVAKDGDVLVFVEVKTRQYDEPTPEFQVNHGKRHRMTRAAKSYLSRYRSARPASRFDIVAIIWPDGQPPTVRHTPSAFQATY